MAAAKIDMSLDEIAKSSNKKRGGRGRGRGRGKGRGRSRGRGGRGRSRGRGGRGRRGRGGRGRSRGRGGYGAQRKSRGPRKTPYSRPTTGQRLSSGSKITVANLDFEVTADDVKEIFQQIGKVKKAVVHYNQSGRSLGTAEVTFASQGLAVKAIEEYDQAEVDGRPMYLKLVASVMPASKVVVPRARSQRRQSRGRGRGRRGRGGSKGRGGYKGRGRGRGRSRGRGGRGRGRGKRGGRGRGRGGRRQQKKPATVEQLDAEMDAYHNPPAAAGQPKTAFTGQPPALNGKKDSE